MDGEIKSSTRCEETVLFLGLALLNRYYWQEPINTHDSLKMLQVSVYITASRYPSTRATDRKEPVESFLNSQKTTGSDAKYSANKLQYYIKQKCSSDISLDIVCQI